MKTKILVIEDNKNNMYLTTFLLESLGGYEVFQAFDGQAGLEMAKEVSPDLILLDIQLSKIDGLQVAKRLKDNPAFHDTPVIALTSFAMISDKEKALAAGCDGFLTKPINPDTFVDEVGKYFISS